MGEPKPNRGRTPDGAEYWRQVRLWLDDARAWASTRDAQRAVQVAALVASARAACRASRAADRGA